MTQTFTAWKIRQAR